MDHPTNTIHDSEEKSRHKQSVELRRLFRPADFQFNFQEPFSRSKSPRFKSFYVQIPRIKYFETTKYVRYTHYSKYYTGNNYELVYERVGSHNGTFEIRFRE